MGAEMLKNLSQVTQPVRTEMDPGQDVSEVCSLSRTKLPFTHGSECPGFFQALGPVSKPSPTKLFAEASGNQIRAALSGGQFLSQERRQNAVFLEDSEERMSKQNSCTWDTGTLTHAHTPAPHTPAHLRPSASLGLPGPQSPALGSAQRTRAPRASSATGAARRVRAWEELGCRQPRGCHSAQAASPAVGSREDAAAGRRDRRSPGELVNPICPRRVGRAAPQ